MSDNEIDYDEPIEQEEEIPFVDSYNAFERVSGFDDEGWRDMTLFQQQADFPHLYMSPEDKFRAEVQQILIFDELPLDKHDKRTITGRIAQMNWVKFKVPRLFILGYYVARKEFSQSSISFAVQNLENIDSAEFELVKYARYWKSLLMY